MFIFNNNSLFKELYDKIQRNTIIKNNVYKRYKSKITSIVKKKHFKTLLIRAIASYTGFMRLNKTHAIMTKLKTIPNSELHSLKEDINSQYIDESISRQAFGIIENGDTTNETFGLKFDNVNITVKSFSSANFNDGDTFGLDRVNMERLYSFLNIVVPFLIDFSDNKKTPIDVHIYLLLSNFKKTFNEDYEVSLGPKNINSGFTIHDGTTKRVVVFRKEECYKVLLHELIHVFRLDLGAICDIHSKKIKEVTKNIQDFFNISEQYNNGRVSVEESYCELLTTFIYTLFYSIERSKYIGSFNEVISLFKKRYAIEYIYSIIKTLNIIQYHTLFYEITQDKNVILSSSLDVLIKTNKHKDKTETDPLIEGIMELVKRKTQHTKTSIIEYIPLKMVLMDNIDDFFTFREKYLNPINVHCSHEQIYKTLLFIYTCLRDNIQHTEQMYNFVLEGIGELKLTNVFMESLCMSTYE